MLFNRVFIVVLCLLASASVFAKKEDNPQGLAPRVDALEELTLQQQAEIDQNTADIEDLQEGGSESGPGWALMDSDAPPKAVGKLVSIANSQTALVELSVEDKSFVAAASHQGFQNAGWSLFFTTADCTGTAYIDVYFEIFDLQDIVLIAGPGGANSRVAYEVVGAPASLGSAGSTLESNGDCNGAFLPQTVVPVESLETDFNALYPPPYNLVKQ